MTLAQLIAQFRRDADDRLEPPLFADEDIIGWLNEAQDEAAIRARLLHESSNPAQCQIAVEAGEAVYTLHPALYELTYTAFARDGDSRRLHIELVSTEFLDSKDPDWRTREGDPGYAIQDDTTLRLAPNPTSPGILHLEGYRLPLEPMEVDGDSPEIHGAHHRPLVQWALHRAFAVPDKDTYDLARSDAAEAEFTRYFGPRPDADLRRVTREDVPHHVAPDWP